MRFDRKKFLFPVITLIIVIIIFEFTLQILSITFPKINMLFSRIPRHLEDKSLGIRPNPAFPEHDKKGFRNETVPLKISIVCMGDSQTYGATIPRPYAWPQQLAILDKIKTYNMAYGGYGPTHSLLLLDEAIKLKPKFIIEAFYSGNDLYDSYNHVYQKGQLPDLKSSDKNILKAIANAENIQPLDKHISRLFRFGKKIPPTTPKNSSLIKHSKLYKLLQKTIRIIFKPYKARKKKDKQQTTQESQWELKNTR